jgi:precorrin-2 dehydrogenase / sirohydrochlorin ferrochelatase
VRHATSIDDYSDRFFKEFVRRSAMTAELAVYPASLLLDGRPVLVVGGGRVAARKLESLLAAGAAVTVVAPVVDPRILAAPVRVERRRYRPGEVARYRLAVTATGDPQVDRLVFEDGERAGVFVNAADDPSSCSFVLPSVARRGPVTVAVSTGGVSPALAAWLRARIEEVVGPEYEGVASALASARAEVRARGVPTEGLDWEALIGALLAAPAGHAGAVVEAWLGSALGTRREARRGA